MINKVIKYISILLTCIILISILDIIEKYTASLSLYKGIIIGMFITFIFYKLYYKSNNKIIEDNNKLIKENNILKENNKIVTDDYDFLKKRYEYLKSENIVQKSIK